MRGRRNRIKEGREKWKRKVKRKWKRRTSDKEEVEQHKIIKK